MPLMAGTLRRVALRPHGGEGEGGLILFPLFWSGDFWPSTG